MQSFDSKEIINSLPKIVLIYDSAMTVSKEKYTERSTKWGCFYLTLPSGNIVKTRKVYKVMQNV